MRFMRTFGTPLFMESLIRGKAMMQSKSLPALKPFYRKTARKPVRILSTSARFLVWGFPKIGTKWAMRGSHENFNKFCELGAKTHTNFEVFKEKSWKFYGFKVWKWPTWSGPFCSVFANFCIFSSGTTSCGRDLANPVEKKQGETFFWRKSFGRKSRNLVGFP